jgi:hypothetical protein
MKKTINKIALISLLFLGLVSCENNGYEDYKQEATPSLAMNGEWYITITDEASGEIQVEHALHKTFDSKDGKMYITDRIIASNPPAFTGWWLETKLDVNIKDLTFSITDALNTADESKVKITEGKIIKNAAKSKDGNVVDSIYFKAVFDYEPTQVLIYSGHKRTGFLEDDF